MNETFWTALDTLLAQSEIIIDRPKGSAHPKFTDIIYPLDYGYLANTSSMDGEGIDVWLGSERSLGITGIVCSVDLLKRDSEIKILVGCTDAERETVRDFHNQRSFMKGLLICRDDG